MNKRETEQGIVLLEAIIAVGVLATIFSAVIALSMGSIEGVRITNDQIVATFLAQDAMEVVIAKRQHNFRNDLPWLNGISNCTPANPCRVDFTHNIANNLTNCGASCPLRIDTTTYPAPFYTAGAGSNTQFSRTVEMVTMETPFGGGTQPFEARVTVRVSWSDGADSLQYALSYNLYEDPLTP